LGVSKRPDVSIYAIGLHRPEERVIVIGFEPKGVTDRNSPIHHRVVVVTVLAQLIAYIRTRARRPEFRIGLVVVRVGTIVLIV
jgi:hypothetical protein